MDKKKIHRGNQSDDLKGFEDFIHQADPNTQVDANPGKNVGGENFTFLENDSIRLRKIAGLMAGRVPMLKEKMQGEMIIETQRKRNSQLKAELFQLLSVSGSPMEKSLASIFNPVFKDLK